MVAKRNGHQNSACCEEGRVKCAAATAAKVIPESTIAVSAVTRDPKLAGGGTEAGREEVETGDEEMEACF
ncbi:hypothetical protein A0J61_07592 [Choanephora cucurbitarum]|uniref:Uncharacterized protein n=1 Tax=Choanephora cucurbitarum TaxID=101091 RepID=A0A1C7N5F3_9FUNG|nr:hypothetical protein A0J61_07592 [Choanephora cucurbitarum]